MEKTMIEQFMAILLPAGLSAVSIILTWLLYELRKWVKERTDSQALDDSLGVLGQVIQNTVAQINETVKEAAQDGVVSKEACPLESPQILLGQVSHNQGELPFEVQLLDHL